MKILHIIEDGTGKKDAKVTRKTVGQFDQDIVVIGRGGRSDIILKDALVSLEHAELRAEGDGLKIKDLGSSAGFRIGSRMVRDGVVRAGNTLRFGESTLRIERTEDSWQLVEEKKELILDSKEQREKFLKKLALSANLPAIGTFSGLLSLAALLIFFLYPVQSKDFKSWNSGPISNSHQLIAQDCKSCHFEPFQKVKDTSCTTCHNMQDHAPAFAPASLHKHPLLERGCVDCHREHNGNDGVTLKESSLCLGCHATPTDVLAQAKAQPVKSVNEHPQFRLMLQPDLIGGEYVRVSMDDEAKLKDNSHIKLNHKKHLEPIRGPEGVTTLQCSACHQPTQDQKGMQPISFVNHCQSCHGLEFDDRLKGVQVPHGNADLVYNTLYAEYAKLFLGNRPQDDSIREAFGISRGRPGEKMPSVQAQPKADEDFKKEKVEQESRAAEDRIYNKTACQLCHRITPSNLTAREAETKKLSMFQVIKPEIKDIWMPQSVFNHRSHEKMNCQDCHKGVSESTRTLQVLMPKIQQCKECHADNSAAGKVESNCVMCHSYHDTVKDDAFQHESGNDLRNIIENVKKEEAEVKAVDAVKKMFDGIWKK